MAIRQGEKGNMQTITRTPEGCQYNLEALPESILCINPTTDFDSLPEGLKWVKTPGFQSPPPIGTRVLVKINKLGKGTVQGYFIEHGWVGVHVLPDARPEWHVKQNGPDKNYYLVFGIEIEPTGCIGHRPGCGCATCLGFGSRPE